MEVLPEASWAMDPVVTDGDTIKDVSSPFAKEWGEFVIRSKIYHYLHRVDEISGIGHFAIMVMGINDGRPLNEPVGGINPKTGKPISNKELNYKLKFLRVYSQENVEISQVETDVHSERYGKPLRYRVRTYDSEGQYSVTTSTLASVDVHWTRVLHVADNRKDSDVFGVPRMQAVYNRIYDLRKVLSGSGEMFWKGGFPGLAFETLPEIPDAEIDTESLDKEVSEYYERLRRYLAVSGMQVKSLNPQIADPSKHVDSMLKIIAIALGIPHRIFAGSEESRLSSSQDARAWNKRVSTRRTKYVEPFIIMEFVDICMSYGFVKNKPQGGLAKVFWPSLDVATEEDRANVADKVSNALAKYVTNEIEHIMELKDFLVHVLGWEEKEADAVIDHVRNNTDEFTLQDEEDYLQSVKGPAAGAATPQQQSNKSDENSRVKSSEE